jgi:pilus assembly protein CpaF
MFTVVISEKGGAERRETFDKAEISVGRVQGNDLMLPKGNVSKQHARLLYRDSRFIVTDLRSTNGTYVNGRKIAQATIVREGDKIYIGDFVLRVESGKGIAQAEAAEVTGAGPAPVPAAVVPDVVASVVDAPPAAAASIPADAPSQPALPPTMASSVPNPPSPPRPGDVQPNLSHFPLERDPDSESAPDLAAAAMPAVPGPPRLPQSVDARPRAATGSLLPGRTSAAPRVHSATSAVTSQPRPATALIAGTRRIPQEAPHQTARRLALAMLVTRVTSSVDLTAIDAEPEPSRPLVEAIERAVREHARELRVAGEVAEGVELDALARDAVEELVGLGPLGPWLEDDQATDLHFSRPEQVIVSKGGQLVLAEPGFTSGDAVGRVVARLARRAGAPLRPGEVVVERRVAGGATLVAIGPPVAASWIVACRKPRRVETTLDDLVRTGAMSRPMAIFLEACVVAKANMLVVGPASGLTTQVLAALAAAAPAGDRIALVSAASAADEIVAAQAEVIPINLAQAPDPEGAMTAAARLGADRLAIPVAGPAMLGPMLRAIAEGAEAVIAGLGAPSLRQGLARAAARAAVALASSIEVAREAISESFDVVVEVGRVAPGGHLRVLRIAEIAGTDAKGVATRDLFISNLDLAGDASFVVTGATPRLAADFAARGVRLDAALFRRVR